MAYSSPHQVRRHRRGSVFLYFLFGIVMFTAMVSLGVDVAHVRVVRSQLQGAADLAARAAAQTLQSGVTASQNAAVALAAANKVDGVALALDTSTDIDFGTWSNGTFTVLSGAARANANAVRVIAAHSTDKGNAVQLAFGRLIGLSNYNTSAQSIATGIPTYLAGFIGYAGVSAKNNTFIGGYSSSTTTTPTENGSNSRMRVGTNSTINGQNNNTINGDPVLGPGASVSGFSVLGSAQHLSSPIPAPAMPAWSAGTNPGNLPLDYTVSSTTTLPAGTYYFTSLTINATLKFSGSSIVYVNGPVTIGDVLTPTSGVPSDLTIYQYGNNTFGDAAGNGMTITARVIAPTCDFTSKNNLYFAGSGVFNTITTKNNADFFYDEAQGPMNGTNAVATVQ
jgi:Flp pilus assembly protein TadG